jgi:SAM-dependent methyltransferase
MAADPRSDRDLWDDKAEGWDRHIGDRGDRNRRRHVHPVLRRMLGEVDGLDVLDAGCGTGYFTVDLVRRGARVTGVDFAPAMLDVARRRVERAGVSARLLDQDCSALVELGDGSFDRVVSIYVLQDLPDLAGAVRSFHRVLRPGGRAVLVFGHPCFGNPGGPELVGDRTIYEWPFPYFDEVRCEEVWKGTDVATGERFDFPSPFTYYHRPLRAYWRAFRDTGFRVLDFDEPLMEPPYAPDVTEADVARSRRCAWSVAFLLERPA